jgi:DNA-binding NtrC family response regulator
LSEQVAEVERAAIAAALKASGGNRMQAARTLGMSRAALYDRLERWPELGGPELSARRAAGWPCTQNGQR